MTPVHLPHDWFPRPLPENVRIGPRSWCYSSFAFLHYRSRRPCGVSIGSDTGIYNGTFFDLGPSGEVRIGNYCTLVGAIICSNLRVIIDDYALLAHEVVLADEGAIRPWSADSPSNGEPAESIMIGRNAWIGTRAVLLHGARIGEGAIVGAGAVVNGTVPPYSIAAGNPARLVGAIRPSS
jgi:acetyltransferase-like isoleucine patch superfamily enzyme